VEEGFAMKARWIFAALLAVASSIRGQTAPWTNALPVRAPVLLPQRTASAYSVELPVIARTGGLVTDVTVLLNPWTAQNFWGAAALGAPSGVRTSVDLINNTSSNGVVASYQFSYTCLSPKCSPQGGFYRTTVQQVILPALAVFHQDDFVEYLANLGLLQPGADQGVLGTLLVTFSNLPSAFGWEGNAIANLWSLIVESDPAQGTVGFATNASLFFDSADKGLVGYARDTTAAPTAGGRFQSNVGVRNTDILGSNQNVTVDCSFYDTVTGARVGNILTLADIKPGQLIEITDVWGSAGISSVLNSVIVFADVRNPTVTSPTIEGYVLWKDTRSQSPRFITMLCTDLDGCGN
jgi:hypothetical protein